MSETPHFSILVAHDQQLGIGKNGSIPFRFRDDMLFFKEITQRQTIVMGRKTFESLPVRPLLNRVNIVISAHPPPSHTFPVTTFVPSFNDAILWSTQHYPRNTIFIIGGAQLYKSALFDQRCIALYITSINDTYDCDVFFPEYVGEWKVDATFLTNDLLTIQKYIRK